MRQRWSVMTDYQLHSDLKKLSEKTRIAVSKLLDEAIEDLLQKHNFYENNKKEIKKNKD